MNSLFIRKFCLFAIWLLAFGAEYASAAPAISGSYEIASRSNTGSRTRVVLRLHLTNNGENSFLVQRILLCDFGERPAAGPSASVITLQPYVTEETTQEFVVPRSQVEQWRRGLPPRIVLTLKAGKGRTISQAIRLEHISAGKGE